MKHTLIENLDRSRLRFPDKIAVVHGDHKLSYLSLWQKSCSLSKYLIELGVTQGDRVCLLMDNSVEYVISYYGVLMAGCAAVGLNTSVKSRDLTNWINHSEASVLIANGHHPEFSLLREKIDISIERIIVIGDTDGDGEGMVRWVDIEDTGDELIYPELSLNPDEALAAIIYTSGTTGHPKGVMLSHRNLYENTHSILTYLGLDEKDSILNVLPFYYSYGNSVLHIHIAVGATLYLENSMLYPQKVMAEMARQKVTGFSGVPSTFNLLLSRTNFKDFDLSSIRYMTQAGGPMAPASITRIKEELPWINFFVMYGQTEASARLSYLPPAMLEEKSASIGIAIPGVELEVMNGEQQPAAVRETGEIYARGKNIMLGYWKDPEMTQSVIDYGWLKTGDLAYRDEDEYLYIVGRSSEMIKSGAHRISPKDIEEVILELSGVEEVAVVGVKDEILGQVIKAFIVKSPGTELDKMKLMRHCKINLANFKIPKQIEFTDLIPRTTSGKVRRFMLEN